MLGFVDGQAQGPGFAGLTAYRSRREVFGAVPTVGVLHNPALFFGQWQSELVRWRKLQEDRQRIETSVEQAHRRPGVSGNGWPRPCPQPVLRSGTG